MSPCLRSLSLRPRHECCGSTVGGQGDTASFLALRIGTLSSPLPHGCSCLITYIRFVIFCCFLMLSHFPLLGKQTSCFQRNRNHLYAGFEPTEEREAHSRVTFVAWWWAVGNSPSSSSSLSCGTIKKTHHSTWPCFKGLYVHFHQFFFLVFCELVSFLSQQKAL